MITSENGTANTMVAVCSALRPPASSRLIAMPAIRPPHISLVLVDGFGLPPLLIMPSTRPADSARRAQPQRAWVSSIQLSTRTPK